METLHTIYTNLIDQPKCWDYYNKNECTFLFENLNKVSTCNDFISTYFRHAGKEKNTFKGFADSLGERTKHVVSTFFLGIYLYENSNYIKENIDTELKTYKETNNSVEFTFIWFLICLFHDLGYTIEEEKDNELYTSFSDFLEKNLCKSSELKKNAGVPNFYANIYKSYFQYRIDVHKKNDHGICAARILFKDLCKIRKRKEDNNDENDELIWDKSLIDVYNFAAWVILAHNIWFIDTNNPCKIAEYNCAGLKELIRKDKEYKISFKEFPTFFLFCLVDSIEFLKNVKDISCFKEIELDIKNSDNEECQIIVKSNLCCGCHDRVLDSVADLNNWLTTTTKNGNEVTIIINPQ
ncbi:MAG: hypothetical protein LBM68_05115 [Bacteroidales bacterium]|jgi:hypothetical protein|nr:hypothetical protein [Bacteroidales bacterium]